MERKLAEPKGTLHQWIAADEHDLKVTEMEAADGLLDWDPWWPVTAKPRGRVADGENEHPSESPTEASGVRGLETVRPQTPPNDDLTVESAILKVEGMLIAVTSGSAELRRDNVLSALTCLASALRTPRRSLEELVYEVGSTSAWGSLLQTERHFGQLADRVEDLSMRLEVSGSSEPRPPIREMVRLAKGLLAEETGAMVDIYWLDAGVVD